MIGQTIDRYKIVEQLGQGGMGVVYKARDTVLDRLVALKVLPPDKSTDPDRRRRFLQEAKSASALNHPGIVSVFDVLTVEGQDVLIMELVEGETLDDVLARRRLPLGEALGIAVRIADALARAHAAGIVHRDLKPSNVMVTADGIKVLDFGLAKLTETPFAGTESPTAAPDELSLTRERVILGTIGWMSPEQAWGHPVDARSDIFAFGVLLYEMLTGSHPFRRPTTVETLAAIREQEPELPSRLIPNLPPEIDRAVLRCLRKEPAKRWQSLSDLGAVLQDLREDSASGRRVIVDAAGPKSRRTRRPWLTVAAGVAIAAVATGLILTNVHAPNTGGPLEVHRFTYDGGYAVMPGISADGKLIAYASDRAGDGQTDIWVRHINQQEPARLTDNPADDLEPRFSPDGSQVVFHSERDGGGVYVVNTLGGETRKLASGGVFPRFSPDGRQVVYMHESGYSDTGLFSMYVVPADGGEPHPFLAGFGASAPPAGIGPLWSPDGTRVLFKGAPLDDPAKRDWWVAPVDGGEPISSGATQSLPKIDIVQFPCVWLPDRVLFVAGTTIEGINLYAASISPEGLIEGPVETLTSGPGMMWTPSVSDDGRIAFSKFQWMIRLWRVEIDPEGGHVSGEPKLVTADAAQKFGLSLAGDAPLLAFSTFFGSPEKRQAELRLHDLESGRETVVVSTVARGISLFPRLSLDASLVAWSEFVDRQRVAFIAETADSSPRELCRDCMQRSHGNGARNPDAATRRSRRARSTPRCSSHGIEGPPGPLSRALQMALEIRFCYHLYSRQANRTATLTSDGCRHRGGRLGREATSASGRYPREVQMSFAGRAGWKASSSFILILLCGSAAAFAQETTGALFGRVHSQDGAPLPGVTITVVNPATGLRVSAVADGSGEYRFLALPPASYGLDASLEGFRPHRENVAVALGQTVMIDIEMQLGAFTDAIEVTASRPLPIDVTSTVVGMTTDISELNDRIPVRREVTQVALLAPGTEPGDQRFDGRTPGQQLASVYGASVAENLYVVNGLNITNFREMLGSTKVPFAFLAEVQIKTGGYEAEYGRSTGGVFNMVTRSGSNYLHADGSLYVLPEDLQGQPPDTVFAPNSSETYQIAGRQPVVGRGHRPRSALLLPVYELRGLGDIRILRPPGHEGGAGRRALSRATLLGRQDRLERGCRPPFRGHLPLGPGRCGQDQMAVRSGGPGAGRPPRQRRQRARRRQRHPQVHRDVRPARAAVAAGRSQRVRAYRSLRRRRVPPGRGSTRRAAAGDRLLGQHLPRHRQRHP